MATYKGINGFAVQSVASDPSPLDEGQVWYNNATYAFKLASVTTAGTWASGGNLNTARRGIFASGGGTQTAALAVGGISSPSSPVPASSAPGYTELYNGTAWTSNPTGLNTGRYLGAGFGTQTAYIGAGGYSFPGSTSHNQTESWNGSTWTNLPATLSSSVFNITGTGTQTAGIVVGYGTTVNQLWNGSSWTTNPITMNTSLSGRGIAGTQTSAIAAGGFNPSGAVSSSESYNGSAWTATSAINTARYFLGASGGSNTSALIFGGYKDPVGPAYNTSTELWNGTSWNNETNMLSARNSCGSAGTAASALASGGQFTGDAILTTTEEWTGAGSPVTKTITTS